MKQNIPTNPSQHPVSTEAQQSSNSKPFLEWKYKLNESSGRYEFDSLQLSKGFELNNENLITAVKGATGTSDVTIGKKILTKVANGMSAEQQHVRLNDASALLPTLHPQDETEALLLGQFLALQDSGMKCLRLANLPDQGFYHVERCFALANKLLNTANQTIQTVLKYRAKGQQTVQVVHVHNEGQAIVTQNLSPNHGEGSQKKSQIEPHGSL